MATGLITPVEIEVAGAVSSRYDHCVQVLVFKPGTSLAATGGKFRYWNPDRRAGLAAPTLGPIDQITAAPKALLGVVAKTGLFHVIAGVHEKSGGLVSR